MKKSNLLFPALLAALMLCDPALAASGTQALNNTLQTILGILQGCSLVVVTIAIGWAGYKILFTPAGIQQVWGPVLGACLIASAPWLAELLVD